MMAPFPLKKFIEYSDGKPISLYLAIDNILIKKLFHEKVVSIIEYNQEIALISITFPDEERPVIRVISLSGAPLKEEKRIEKQDSLFTSYFIPSDKLTHWMELL